jgi:putative tricarboxylic transport membrane protein
MDASFVLSVIWQNLSNPRILFFVFAGTFMGLTFGALPGLTTTMAIALLIPLTYTLPPQVALGMMLGCYVGGISGGAISSILLGIPGTSSALVTTFDGYPMAKNGRAAEALGWAAISSGVGGIFSWLVLITLSPVLAAMCTSFSSPEYAMLTLFGLTMVASMTDKNMTRGLVSAAIGVFIGGIGMDPIFGIPRLTFRNLNLLGGLGMMPLVIGMYAIPQVLDNVDTRTKAVGKLDFSFKNYIPSPIRMWKTKFTWLVGSVIGTFIGIIPATGQSLACFMSYDRVKNWSKTPERFGKGTHHGVAVAECANNAVCGGALVPLLTLGIPGDGITAIMMGGFIIQGLQPGPKFFVDHPDIVISIFTTLFIGTLMMVIIQLGAIKFFARIIMVPNCYLATGIMVVALVGSFALRNNFFDVTCTLVMGVAAYFLRKGGFVMPALMLGLVLGKMFEMELRITLGQFGTLLPFVTRPIALLFFIIALFMIARSAYKTIKDTRKELTVAKE